MGFTTSLYSPQNTGIDDYMPLTFTFTFDDQSSRSCIDVITIGDTILENDEEFTLTLSTSDNMIELRPDAATVSITDNDRTLAML